MSTINASHLPEKLQVLFAQSRSRAIKAGETVECAEAGAIGEVCGDVYDANLRAGKTRDGASAAAQAINDSWPGNPYADSTR